MSEKEQIEEILGTLDDRAFLSFLVLKTLVDKKNAKINRQDLHLIYTTYALLLIERKNYVETEKKLLALNGFMGLV